jgi:stage III sporulation protein AE
VKKLIITLLLIFLLPASAQAAQSEDNSYKELYESSGAASLEENISKETGELMEMSGISSPEYEGMTSPDLSKIFTAVGSSLKEQSKNPLQACLLIFLLTIICALVGGVSNTLEDSSSVSTARVASVLAVSIAMINPVLQFIGSIGRAIEYGSAFEKAFIPVFAGIMVFGGQAGTAGGYATLSMLFTEISAEILSSFLLPVFRVIFAVSVVSSVSNAVDISSLTESADKAMKWILGFLSVIFGAVMSISGMVAASADTVASKAAKFAVSSSVPVIGGSLGDAFSSLQSCVGLLKNSVGAFGIVAVGFTYLPVILQGIMWCVGLNLCAGASDMLAVPEISKLLKSAAGVVSMLLTICIFMLTILIMTAGIVLTLGKGGA